MSKEGKARVLFLCTGNSARSQMAEGLLRKMVGDKADIHSAGIDPAGEIHPLARRVMAEFGVDLTGQYPKSIEKYMGQEFDLVVTTCDHANERCPFLPGDPQRLHWGLDDPAKAQGTEEERLTAFRTVANELAGRLRLTAALIENIARKRKRG